MRQRSNGLTITTAPPREAWQRFVDAHPAGNMFQTPAWERVVAATRGWRPQTLAALDAGGEVVALWPAVLTTVVGGPLKPFATRAVLFGGPLVAPGEHGQRGLADLLGTLNRRAWGRFLFSEIRHQADNAPSRESLAAAGFAWEPHLNYLIDLTQDEQTLWAALSSSARRNVRTAEKKGVQALEVTDHAGVDRFYALLVQVYRHAAVPLTDASLFHAAFDELFAQGRMRIVLAHVDGRVIGGRASLLYRGRLIDWYAGADRTAAKYYPNDYLVWQALRWGHERHYNCFDFGGAGHPDKPYGVRDFKARFGGEPVNYGRSIKIHAPWYAVALRVYEVYRGRMLRGREMSSP